MQTITTIGLDIAKSVFQVHGVDAEGNMDLRRQLKRRLIGLRISGRTDLASGSPKALHHRTSHLI
jgi:transposase